MTVAGDATAVAVVEATADGIKTASINTAGAGYFGGGNGVATNITATTAGPGINARFDVEVLSSTQNHFKKWRNFMVSCRSIQF